MLDTKVYRVFDPHKLRIKKRKEKEKKWHLCYIWHDMISLSLFTPLLICFLRSNWLVGYLAWNGIWKPGVFGGFPVKCFYWAVVHKYTHSYTLYFFWLLFGSPLSLLGVLWHFRLAGSVGLVYILTYLHTHIQALRNRKDIMSVVHQSWFNVHLSLMSILRTNICRTVIWEGCFDD